MPAHQDFAASAVVYSIVKTAKANNLNIYIELNYLLLYTPDMGYKNCAEVMEDMLPWLKCLQQECEK